MMKKAAAKEQSRDGPAVHVKRVTFMYTHCPAGGDIGLQINFRIRHGYVVFKDQLISSPFIVVTF